MGVNVKQPHHNWSLLVKLIIPSHIWSQKVTAGHTWSLLVTPVKAYGLVNLIQPGLIWSLLVTIGRTSSHLMPVTPGHTKPY